MSSEPYPSHRIIPAPHKGVDRARADAFKQAVERLDDDEAWRFGVDLFNAHYFWEAHEAWERLWHSAPDGSRAKSALKGLIQIAAALLKLHAGNELGARRLAQRGVERLEAAAQPHGEWRGLVLLQVAQTARTRLAHAASPLSLESSAFSLEPRR
jgi:predicted metal-dependent hydrolase